MKATKPENCLLCVCGSSLKCTTGETIEQLANRLGWAYYPNSPHKPTNALCDECKALDDE